MSLELALTTDQLRFFPTGVVGTAFAVGVNAKQVTAQAGTLVPIIKFSTTGGADELGLYVDTDGTSVRVMESGGARKGPVIATIATGTWYQFALVGSSSAGVVRLTGYVGAATPQGFDFTGLNNTTVNTLFIGTDYYSVFKGRFSDAWGQIGAASAATVAAYFASSTPGAIVPTGSYLLGGSLHGTTVAAALGTLTVGTAISGYGMNPGTGAGSADDYTYAGTSLSIAGGGEFPTTPIVAGISASPNTVTFQVGAAPVVITVTDSNGNPVPAGIGVVSVAPFGGVTTDGSTNAAGQFSVYPGVVVGSYTAVITYTDIFRGPLSANVAVNVLAAAPPTIVAPVFSISTLPNAAASAPYHATVAASQVSSYAITAGPAWLTIDPITGQLGGTAPGTTGAVTPTIRARNSAGDTFISPTFNIVANPFISGSTLPAGQVGVVYTPQSIANAAAAFSANGVPGGMQLASIGTVSGTPTASGNFTFISTAVYPDGTTATKVFSINIAPAPSAGGSTAAAAARRAIPRPRRRVFAAAEFALALSLLMPRGPAWPRDPGSIQQLVLAGIGQVYAQLNERADYLLVDGNPAFTLELLPEWEASLGLPDPCAGISPTLDQRRSQVIARVSSQGGQSAAYFTQLAADLGYTVTVQSFSAARIGQSRCGDPCNGEAWAYAWAITAPTYSLNYARASAAACGEPLASWSNAVLECELGAAAPAHSTLQFRYT